MVTLTTLTIGYVKLKSFDGNLLPTKDPNVGGDDLRWSLIMAQGFWDGATFERTLNVEC